VGKRPQQCLLDKIVGAIGVSGMTSAQDGQCAKAGAEALK